MEPNEQNTLHAIKLFLPSFKVLKGMDYTTFFLSGGLAL